MIIGERLRAIRNQKKLTYRALERSCGISKTYISRIEQGHIIPSVDELEAIAKGLEVPLHELFYDPSEHLPSLKNLTASSREEDEYLGSCGRNVGIIGWLRTRFSKTH
jgi:transcriptional regulator with XRE-family HTH domain